MNLGCNLNRIMQELKSLEKATLETRSLKINSIHGNSVIQIVFQAIVALENLIIAQGMFLAYSRCYVILHKGERCFNYFAISYYCTILGARNIGNEFI